jgi:hypothetical protein
MPCDPLKGDLKMPEEIVLDYPAVTSLFGNHLIAARLESRAFLAWYLENYYRLTGDDAEDSVCDGPDDKGIDGIYVDKNFEHITISIETLPECL